MSKPNSKYDLLFSVLALQNKFVSRDQLIEALNFWAIDKQRSLAEIVAERAAITATDQELLKRLVDRQLEVHGELEASLCENTGTLDLADHCSQIDDVELREQLQSFSSRSANSQLTMTRMSTNANLSRINSRLDQVGRDLAAPAAKQSQSNTENDPDQTLGRDEGVTDPDLRLAAARSITSVRPSNRPGTEPVSHPSNPRKSDSENLETIQPNSRDLRESKRTGGSTRQPNAAPARSTAASRFSIVNSHAKGGLGEVFLAHDNELDREVALKEIQPKFASNEDARLRFEFEACITGGLAHPGVVPVYAYGKYTDGRPFYAMRFIRGHAMKDEIAEYHKKIAAAIPVDELRLALRGLLARFVDACQAIAYAHSRGVVHRDLKPANVMLGKFGETLVVDWGLAKSVGRDEYHYSPSEITLLPMSGSSGSDTMQGSAIGTPGYMSPEQASGRLQEMGPASDIFSLGATLYNILVGNAPFEGKKASEIVANAAENRFVEPIKKLAQIPRPLNAIVMKAMATEPRERYHTALELAFDVEAYLSDDLVAAYRETAWEKSQRWIRRHRTLATAAVVLLTTLGLASAIGAVRINAEQNRTLLALDQVRVEQSKTTNALAALTIEQEKTEQALAAETSARRQTREMLNTISDDLVGELMGRQVVLTEANQRFFDRVLQQFDQFTTSLDSTDEAKNLRADGFFRVANLQRRLVRLDPAQKAYLQAIESWQQLAKDFPRNLNYQQDLAAAEGNLGLVYAAQSNFPAALEQYTLAAKQFSEILELAKLRAPTKSPNDEPKPGVTTQANVDDSIFVSTGVTSFDAVAASKIQLELARLNGNLANTLVQLNRRAEAELYYRKALDGFASLQSSSLATAMADQARVLGNYAGFVAREPGRLPEARQLMEEAVNTLSVKESSGELVVALPPNLRFDRSSYLKNLSKILVGLGEKELAVQKSRATVQELSELSDEFPAIADYRRELAANQFELANLLRIDDLDEANLEFSSAITTCQRIIADNPGQTRTQRLLAASLENWGAWLAETQFDGAFKYFEQARQLRRELHQAEPNNPTLRDEWIMGENNLANQHRTRKAYELAIPIYSELIKTLDQATDQDQDPLYKTKLRIVRFGLADSLTRTDDYQRALPIWTQLVANRQDSDWSIFELQRAICLIRTGEVEIGLVEAVDVVNQAAPEPVWLFDAACCYAIAHELSVSDKNNVTDPSKPKPQTEKTEEYAQAAIKYLILAGKAGFFDSPEMREHALGDNDLKSLINRPDFKSFQEKYLEGGIK